MGGSAGVLVTGRLRLEPLTVAHATEMVDVLGDVRLYEFIGGTPPTLAQLERLYVAQTRGWSEDGRQQWLNWVIRFPATGGLVGYVQATVQRDAPTPAADLAWVVDPRAQGRGIATEAVSAMVGFLAEEGVERFTASIHPGNVASEVVARRQGLRPTDDPLSDGERRWASGPAPS